MILRNPTDATIAVRDDAGKHLVEPGATLALTGDQHRAAAEAAGLVHEDAPAPAPRKRPTRRKAAAK